MDPFKRIMDILKAKDPENYKASNVSIKGEKFLHQYKVNKSTVVENSRLLYNLNFDKEKRPAKRCIEICGAETNKGRWVAVIKMDFPQSGRSSPVSSSLICPGYIFDSKECAIICKMNEAISYCDDKLDGPQKAFAKKVKNNIIKARDELIMSI